mgnify:FL=1
MQKRGKLFRKEFNQKTGRKSKRAQIAIFVIVALIIITALIAIFLIRSRITPAPQTGILSAQVEQFRLFMEGCVENVSYAGFERLGLQAGYYDFADSGLRSIDFAGEKVVVAEKLDSELINRLPNQQQIEEQFKLYMLREGYAAIDGCTKDFAAFKGQFNIQQDKSRRQITAQLREDDVIIKTVWPLRISRGQQSIEINHKDIRLFIPLGKILRVATDIVNKESAGIAFTGTQIDSYINTYPSRLRTLRLDAEHFPSHLQDIFFITTLPYRPREKAYRFYFAVDRS